MVVTLKEEHRLRVLENRVPRGKFVPKRVKVTEELRKLHYDELNGLYVLLPKCYSSDQIKKNEMGGACNTYGGYESCVQGFGGESCGKEAT